MASHKRIVCSSSVKLRGQNFAHIVEDQALFGEKTLNVPTQKLLHGVGHQLERRRAGQACCRTGSLAAGQEQGALVGARGRLPQQLVYPS